MPDGRPCVVASVSPQDRPIPANPPGGSNGLSCLMAGSDKHPHGTQTLNVPTFFEQMEDKMDRLKGKVILISGGARGQGAAEARLFTAEGARVIIGDVLESEGHRLASELGDAAVFVRQDVTQETDWETAVNAAEKFGGL